ncbi:MAG: OsmC family protein [Gammaproteobacteria bacterium]|nr:OsmC family protein [Gammaproteobacteria bacterium]
MNELPHKRDRLVRASGDSKFTHLIYGDGSSQRLDCDTAGAVDAPALLAGALAACAWRSLHDLLQRLELDTAAVAVEVLAEGDRLQVAVEGITVDEAVRQRARQAIRRCPVARQLKQEPEVTFHGPE